MAELNRTYVIPLRRGWIRIQAYRRTPRAVREIKNFCKRHMKSEDIRVLEALNTYLWVDGRKNPPSKVQVDCKRTEEGVCYVQLHGVPFPEKKEVKKEAAGSKLMEKFGIKASESKKEEKVKEAEVVAEKKTEKKEEAKKETHNKTAEKPAELRLNKPATSKPKEAPKQMGH